MAAPKRIVVVDDNRLLRTLVAHALEDAGYVALAAESADAALELARTDPPDLLVVDYVMPGMNGADLIRTLRSSADARLRGIPAIGLSAVEGSEQELLAAGATAALRKPLEETVLLAEVRRVLGEP